MMKVSKIKGTLMIAVLLLTTLAIAIPLASAADTWYVDNSADPDGDGTTLLTAFDTIGEAITAAVAGDTILVTAGTYIQTEDLVIDEEVSILGVSETKPTIQFDGKCDSVVIKADNVLLEHLSFYKTNTEVGWMPPPPTCGANVILEVPKAGLPDYLSLYEGLAISDCVFEGGCNGAMYINMNGDFTVEDSEFIGYGAPSATPGKSTGYSTIHIAAFEGTVDISRNKFTGDGGRSIVVEPGPDQQILYGGTMNLIENTVTGKTSFLVYNHWADSSKKVDINIEENILEDIAGDAISIFTCGDMDISKLASVQITGNTFNILDGSAIRVDTTYASTVTGELSLTANLNNIYSNTYGIINEYTSTIDATLNWWGTSDPDAVDLLIDGLVDYSPWLGAVIGTTPMPINDGHATVEDPVIPGDPVDTNVTGSGSLTLGDADTTVTFYDADECIITIQDLAETDVSESTFAGVGKYVDVKIDDTDAVDELLIKVYYDDTDDLDGLDESMLIMYWYDGTDWLPCSDTGVNTDNDYIWAKIRDDTSPSLADMTGTEFGVGGSISLDSTVYKTGDEITVTVVDYNANIDPIRIETLEVHTNSTIDIVGIDVELTETGVNTSIFTGSFMTTGEVPPAVGELAVNDTNVVMVIYDAGIYGDVSVTAVIDDVEPEITVTTLGKIIGQNVTTVTGTFDEPNIDTIYVGVVKATIDGDEFTAVNVPLLYGNNTVTAVATDLCGLTNSSSTWIVSDTIGPAMTTDASAKPPKAIATGKTYLSVNFTDVWSVMGSVLVNLTDIGGDEDQAM
ncbi:MAG: right-handed parallel beta-helix repeat-containing protein, partial [Proteobacteria bacterium]|nr:right-handed parallel beta-helix repeat-containing protein [Pseudomonadota bacterium]